MIIKINAIHDPKSGRYVAIWPERPEITAAAESLDALKTALCAKFEAATGEEAGEVEFTIMRREQGGEPWRKDVL